MSIERPDNLEGKVITVYGATSKLGMAFMETATARGASIIAFARTPDKMSDQLKNNPHVLVVTGDITDPHAVDRAIETGFQNFENVDATVNFASVLYQARRKTDASRPVNVWGEQNVIKSTVNHSVPRHIYVSSIAALMEGGTNAYATTKLEAEKAVKESGLNYVILRPANVIGTSDPDDIWNNPLVPIVNVPKVPLRRDSRFPFTTPENVTEATIAALDHGDWQTVPIIDGYKSMDEYIPDAHFLPPWMYAVTFGAFGILSAETRSFISSPPDIDLKAAERHLHVK